MIAILMGSDSDWPVMKEAAHLLEEFGVPFKAQVLSAHRTPQDMLDFAKEAAQKGFQVLIAGAGGAAHLPGMLASQSTLPVIGVPIANTPLQGQDALYSILQMPKGVPVACVGIQNAQNAALLALRILACQSPQSDLHKKLIHFIEEQAQKSRAKNCALGRGE